MCRKTSSHQSDAVWQHSSFCLSVCHEWRITLSITHKTLSTLTTEDASHQPIEGCTALIKCRLELNCHRRYSIMHTDFTSSYYAKPCFEIPMCLRLVQQLMECGTVAGNSGGNSTSEISLSEFAGIKQWQVHHRLPIERHPTTRFKGTGFKSRSENRQSRTRTFRVYPSPRRQMSEQYVQTA
jgi:hypothetical protein